MKQCMVMRNKNTEVAQMKRVWDGSRLIGWWKIEQTAVWLIKDTGDTFWNIMVFVWYEVAFFTSEFFYLRDFFSEGVLLKVVNSLWYKVSWLKTVNQLLWIIAHGSPSAKLCSSMLLDQNGIIFQFDLNHLDLSRSLSIFQFGWILMDLQGHKCK